MTHAIHSVVIAFCACYVVQSDMTKHKTAPEERERMVQLYQSGLSAQEVHDALSPSVTVRQIQRMLRNSGIIRSTGDAFRRAVAKGRVPYHLRKTGKKPRKTIQSTLRYQIMQRDSFRCVKCGRGASACPLDVDHIDDNQINNKPENLQVLCHDCNIGKHYTG
jgi:ferredoxin